MILAFIMMCQLMFKALNMNKILLSMRLREFVVGSNLTGSPFILALYNFAERVCPMLLVTKTSVTMPCETNVLGKFKIPVVVYILLGKGKDSILCYPGCPVDATRWRLSHKSVSQAGNTLSPFIFSVGEMGSLLQVLRNS